MKNFFACILVAGVLTGGAWAQDQRRSGFEFMSKATQAMQLDNAQNPAILWVKDGEIL